MPKFCIPTYKHIPLKNILKNFKNLCCSKLLDISISSGMTQQSNWRWCNQKNRRKITKSRIKHQSVTKCYIENHVEDVKNKCSWTKVCHIFNNQHK